MSKPAIDQILQIGIVVRDVKKTVKVWEEIYGIGPWNIRLLSKENGGEFKINGEPVDEIQAYLALSAIGDVNLELIEPVSQNSDYAKFLNEHGEGLHHIAIKQNEQYYEILKARKIPEILSGVLGGTKKCTYFDTKEDLGILTEIYEML